MTTRLDAVEPVPRSPSRRGAPAGVRFWLGLATATASVALLAFPRIAFPTPSTADGIALAASCWAGLILVVAWGKSSGIATRCYGAAFWLFHLSIPTLGAIGLDFSPKRLRHIEFWLEADAYGRAVVLSSAALLAFAGVAAIAGATIRPRSPGSRGDEHLPSGPVVALGLVVVGFLAWSLAVVDAGTGFVSITYETFLTNTAEGPLALGNLALGFGFVLAVGSRRARMSRVAMGVFAAWATLALPLGLRGEVLFPVLAAMTLYIPRTSRRQRVAVAAVVLVLIPLMSSIAEFRNESDVSAGEYLAEANFLDVVTELGTTLRVPTEAIKRESAVRMTSNNANAFVDTLEYTFASVFRFAADRPQDRIGPSINLVTPGDAGLGSSPVAESYLSGGPLAVVTAHGMLSLFLGYLDRRSGRSLLTALLLFPLLVAVRNEFVVVPYQWLLAMGIYGACMVTGTLPLSRPNGSTPGRTRWHTTGARAGTSGLPARHPSPSAGR